MKNLPLTLLASALLFSVPAYAAKAELRGSPASMVQQNQVARTEGYTFIASPAEVEKFVKKERLVRAKGNADYVVSPGVSYPFARPAVVLFLERISAQYRDACGERLVVTSLTRPAALQPGNAHQLSVHPAGMAADLRISQRAECRQWLETTLLELENKDLLDVTRERNPPHYHVAVFPEAYMAYVERMREADERAAVVKVQPATPAPVAEVRPATEEEPTRRDSSKGPLVVMALVAGAFFGHKRRRAN